MGNYLLVAIGGAIGSVARYALASAAAPISATIPWGTIIINILGSFLIGWFASLTTQSGRLPLSDEARVFVMVGLCGGFTTFSSFSLQTFALIRNDQFLPAVINVAVSVIVCVAATAAGHAIAVKYGLPLFSGR